MDKENNHSSFSFHVLLHMILVRVHPLDLKLRAAGETAMHGQILILESIFIQTTVCFCLFVWLYVYSRLSAIKYLRNIWYDVECLHESENWEMEGGIPGGPAAIILLLSKVMFVCSYIICNQTHELSYGGWYLLFLCILMISDGCMWWKNSVSKSVPSMFTRGSDKHGQLLILQFSLFLFWRIRSSIVRKLSESFFVSF